MADAVVVGSGPNGLAAAVALARDGLEVTVLEAADAIGGGTRTEELTVPGVLHDVCSAIHPFGAASPFFASLSLAEHGLTWLSPEIDLVNPLSDGRAGILYRSLDRTVEGMDGDGAAWRRTFERLSTEFPAYGEDLLRPLLAVPHHPLKLAAFGPDALLPATALARRFMTAPVRALFAGVAAHSVQPLTRPTTASVGLMLIAAGHHVGWPVAEGGSRAITDALASLLKAHGGTIETGVRVTTLDQIPPSAVSVFDVSPRAMLAIAGDALPPRVRRAYERFRYGAGSFKVDLAVEGGVPWTVSEARRSATVHVAGTLEDIAAAEDAPHRGRMPERPFILVAQQHVIDPSRSKGDVHPVWAYCHVPHGWDGDATDAIVDQIERFAPGTCDRIVGSFSRGPAQLEAYNANYVGGDIATGSTDPRQLLVRPRFSTDPYSTGIPGVFLCSSATPPGGGVHGMCGAGAAASALRHIGRRRSAR